MDNMLTVVDASLLWIPAVLACVSLLFIYGALPMKTWSRIGVPGPPSLPFIGNMHQLLNKKTGSRANFSRWQKLYGNIYGIQCFRKPCLVVSEPDLINWILVKDFGSYTDRFSMAGDAFMPKAILEGLVFQGGEDWRRARRIMTPVFTAGKLKMVVSHVNATARRLAVKLQQHAAEATKPEAKTVFGAFSLDVIAGTAFGLDLDSQNNQDGAFFKSIEAIFKIKSTLKFAIATTGMFPFLGHIFKLFFNTSTFDPHAVQYFKEVLERIVSERANTNQRDVKSAGCSDFFQLLAAAEIDDSEADGEITTTHRKLSELELVYQGITFVLAGYETTSSTLQYLTHNLANYPDVQTRMIEEIRTVVTDLDTADVSYETCQKLKYTEAVIRETLRMYPPLFQLKREATRDTVLNGIPVSKGVGIIIPVYNICRDPEHFDDPDCFNPDRFLDNNDSTKLIHLMPFGFGPRQCIGMRLAMMEMKIALVHVLGKVNIQDVEPKEIDLHDYSGLLVPKQPFRLTLGLQ